MFANKLVSLCRAEGGRPRRNINGVRELAEPLHTKRNRHSRTPPANNHNFARNHKCARPASATRQPAATPGTPPSLTPPKPFQPTNTTPPRLELLTPCQPTHNLLTCPDFSARQPRGPASIPHLHGLPCCTPEWACPRCGPAKPDMRFKRVCEFRQAGVRVGRDAGRDGAGQDVVCCAVM